MMILQNHYQRRRMYTRIALGKNRAMDVVSGESSGGTGQLVVLYPLLFGLQGFQCMIGTCNIHTPKLANRPQEGNTVCDTGAFALLREPKLQSHYLWLIAVEYILTLDGFCCRVAHAEGDIWFPVFGGRVAGARGARERPEGKQRNCHCWRPDAFHGRAQFQEHGEWPSWCLPFCPQGGLE